MADRGLVLRGQWDGEKVASGKNAAGNLKPMSTRRNPLAGIAMSGSDDEEKWKESVCSTLTGEQLAGTARGGNVILALEHPRGWGRDILDGEALGTELSQQIKKFIKSHRAQLQFIRQPGRAGQHHEMNDLRPVLYISWSAGVGDPTQPVLERMRVDGPESILELDLSQSGHTPGAERVEHPVLLVCTHGKRDQCCAVWGRPLASDLSEKWPRDYVWETSHTKGHRFAPATMLLPGNYSYGRNAVNSASEILEHAQRGELWLQGNRGRGVWDNPGQVAELAVGRMLQGAGENVPLAGLQVSAPEGQPRDKRRATREVRDAVTERRWLVELESRPSVMAKGSCGDKPKRVSSWVALGITE